MAKPTIELIEALREAAHRMKDGAYYAWGHHGACNCGNLVQVVTNFNKEEILRYAHTGTGEWTEIAEEYCPVTCSPLNLVISRLEEIGLTPTDIHNIEYLADKEVLQNLPGGFRWLKRNKKEDAVTYFEAFAGLLEDKLIGSIDISMLAGCKATCENDMIIPHPFSGHNTPGKSSPDLLLRVQPAL